MTDIQKMSDDELVRAVAVEVIGNWCILIDDEYYLVPKPQFTHFGGEITDVTPYPEKFRPLTDANHRDMVVAKVRALPFSKRRTFWQAAQRIASENATPEKFIIAWPDVFWFMTPRIWLEAALAAVRENP